MKVLIGCERSGIVRDAFLSRGHDAVSCDVVPCEVGGPHITDDLRNVICGDWDMLIAHPPCQYLTYAGAHLFSDPERQIAQDAAIDFFAFLLDANIDKIALENPRGVIPQVIRKPDDMIEPWMFGHPYTKRTYLWLKNLPPLLATNVVVGKRKSWTSSAKDSTARSRTFPGVALAMAAQWG